MCPLLLKKSFVESMEQAMESTNSDVDFRADYKVPFHASPSIATSFSGEEAGRDGELGT